MICLNCNKEFEPKRADAKYCSALCKLKYNRKSSDTDKLDTDKLVVNDTDNETPNDTDKSEHLKPTLNTPEHLKEYTDHCHFCNHKFAKTPDGEQLIGYICSDCITKAMNSDSQYP